MAVQDLTPQLRTRLSRLEKAVGWFVTIATLLLLAGLAYYVRSVARNKGWFVTKAPYFTYLASGAGIKVGDKVRLMGFNAGEITKIVPEEPGKEFNVYVEFEITRPDYGYVWDDSVVKVKSAGLLGDRFLEITKGGSRRTNNLSATYREDAQGKLTSIYLDQENVFTNWHKGDKPYWLFAEEPPELASQLDDMVGMLKVSLTNILFLTNALTKTLTNAAEATGHLNELLVGAKPIVANLAVITGNITNPLGSLGEWLLPVAMNAQVTTLLTNANATVGNVNTTVTNVNTNLVVVLSQVIVSLENLAGITSNLNAQVQSNTNIVSSLSSLITDADGLVQGLKKHWLLRSAFKEKEPAKPAPKKSKP